MKGILSVLVVNFACHTRREKDQVCIPACAKEDSSKFPNMSCAGGGTGGKGFP